MIDFLIAGKAENMPAEYTIHPIRVSRDSNNSGGLVAYGAQIGNVATVADASASSEIAVDCIARVTATSDVRIRHGADVTNGDNGTRLDSGMTIALDVRAGETIGISARA